MGSAKPSLTSTALVSDLKDEREIIMFTATQLYTGERAAFALIESAVLTHNYQIGGADTVSVSVFCSKPES